MAALLDELLTKREIAELLKISTRSIDRKIADGEFPQGIKLGTGRGAAVRWPKSVYDDFVARKVARKVVG